MDTALSYLAKFRAFRSGDSEKGSKSGDGASVASGSSDVSIYRLDSGSSFISSLPVTSTPNSSLGDHDDSDSDLESSNDESSLNDDDSMADIDTDIDGPENHFRYAPANVQQEFRKAFNRGEVPDHEKVLKAYVCAISKEILYHGKMYVTPHYVCFYSKLFNTQKVVIPFSEIVKIEPKMVMTFIPNALAIRTRTSRYTFASLTARNRTMQVLKQLRNSSPAPSLLQSSSVEDEENTQSDSGNATNGGGSDADAKDGDNHPSSGSAVRHRRGTSSSGRGSLELAAANPNSTSNGKPETRIRSGSNQSRRSKLTLAADTAMPSPETPAKSKSGGAAKNWPCENLGPDTHSPTALPELNEGEKLVCTETVDAPVGVVANIMFGKDTAWYRHFLVDVEKNRDLDSLPAFPDFKKGAKRDFSYTKPLSGPVGPKQTKCNSTEEIEVWDFDSHIEVITTTATPDVPSGSSFTTLTRTILTWADNNRTEIRLGTWLDWKAKSWLKSAIEKGALDGQMSYGKALVEELANKIENNSKPASAKPVATSSSGIKPADQVDPKKERAKRAAAAKQANDAIREWQRLCMGLALACAVLLVLVIYLYFRRGKMASRDIEEGKKLLRIEEELDLWEWIDHRRSSQALARRRISNANIEAALTATEKRLERLKAELIE